MELSVTYDYYATMLKVQSCTIDQQCISIVVGNESKFGGDSSLTFEVCIVSEELPVTVELLAELPCTSKTANTSSGELKRKFDNLKKLYDPSTTDFTFYIADSSVQEGTKTFRVHKAKLAAVSPVFHNMFREFSEKKINSIAINNINADEFGMLLHFIYVGVIPAELSKVMRLYGVAHKFEIGKLKVICKKMVQNKLRPETAWDIYDWSNMCKVEDVKMVAWEIIKR